MSKDGEVMRCVRMAESALDAADQQIELLKPMVLGRKARNRGKEFVIRHIYLSRTVHARGNLIKKNGEEGLQQWAAPLAEVELLDKKGGQQ